MTVTILGSGGSVNTQARHNTSILLHGSDAVILVDCNGVAAQRITAAGHDIATLTDIFLTHEHIDHIAGLPSLIHQIWVKACLYDPAHRRTAPLIIHANARSCAKARGLIETLDLPDHPHIFPILFRELPYEGGSISACGIDVEYFPVMHGPTPCFGLEWKAKNLVYSGDTEPCDAVFSRIAGDTTLLHDCNKIDVDINPEHTTWAQLETRLARMDFAKLVLLHLPPLDPEKENRFRMQIDAALQGRVVLGRDGMRLDL